MCTCAHICVFKAFSFDRKVKKQLVFLVLVYFCCHDTQLSNNITLSQSSYEPLNMDFYSVSLLGAGIVLSHKQSCFPHGPSMLEGDPGNK